MLKQNSDEMLNGSNNVSDKDYSQGNGTVKSSVARATFTSPFSGEELPILMTREEMDAAIRATLTARQKLGDEFRRHYPGLGIFPTVQDIIKEARPMSREEMDQTMRDMMTEKAALDKEKRAKHGSKK